MTTTTHTPAATTRSTGRTPTARGWAVAGTGAGIAGIVSMVASSMAGAVYDPALAGDAVGITEKLAEQSPQILLFHTATMVSALLMVVFAAGLRRRLVDAVGPQSLLPGVAASGLLLVAAAQLLGSGLTTEFVFGVQDPDLLVPEAAVLFGHWIGTIPWLWGTAGLAALAVAAASLRHRALPKWLGVISLGLGGLALLFAISPLQYMAGMVGPIWLTVAAIGFTTARAR